MLQQHFLSLLVSHYHILGHLVRNNVTVGTSGLVFPAWYLWKDRTESTIDDKDVEFETLTVIIKIIAQSCGEDNVSKLMCCC